MDELAAAAKPGAKSLLDIRHLQAEIRQRRNAFRANNKLPQLPDIQEHENPYWEGKK